MILQLLVYFGLGAGLGAALGWTLRGGGARKSLEHVDQDWARRLDAAEAERDRLRTELEEASAARAELEAALNRAEAAGEDLRRRSERERAEASGELERLRTELAAAKERIAVLEEHLVQAREAAAEGGAGSAGESAAPEPEDARAATPPLRLDAPEGPADDLKRITGIGPGTERTLNGLGIYHFRQIAELSPENVAWIERHLRFKGRIAREDWVGQARELAARGTTSLGRSGIEPRH